MSKIKIVAVLALFISFIFLFLFNANLADAATGCRMSRETQRNITFTVRGEDIYLNRDGDGLWDIARKLCVSYDLLVAYNYVLIPREPAEGRIIKIPPDEEDIYWLPGRSITVPEDTKMPQGQNIFFELTPTSRFVWPLTSSEAYISQPHQDGHHAIDIAAVAGSTVVAVANGRVDRVVENHHILGNTVIIDHGHDLLAIYAHLSKISVEVDTLVQQNQVIGQVGSTGRSSGPHLHLEIRDSFAPIDPCFFFDECGINIYNN